MVPFNLFNLGVAFAAGFLSFFAGCLLPIVPTYLSYIAGITLAELKGGKTETRRAIWRTSVAFVLGFILTFMVLAAGINLLAQSLAGYRTPIQIFGGMLVILLGLHLLGVVRLAFLYRRFELKVDGKLKLPHGTILSAFLLGVVFGLSWTPCIGPVLASIILWSSQSRTFLEGIVLLLAFGIGLGIPFLALGAFASRALAGLKRLNRYLPLIERLTGSLLVLVGLLLISGQYSLITRWLVSVVGSWAFILNFRF